MISPGLRLNSTRLIYAAMTALVIVAGLAWRRPELGLPPFAAKYGGSVLWGAMVFFAVATVFPAARLMKLVVLALLISATVEFSQLIHVDWLDAARRTTIGRLLIGVTFTWWDIVAYWIGVAIAGGGTSAFFLLCRRNASASSSR
jgi:hypothetical protein